MNRYTEGPWRAAPAGRVIAQDSEWRLQVCKVGAFDDPEMLRHSKSRWEADTHLIAAAPELLNVLERLFDEYDDRRSQFGSDPLWKKWEDVDAVEEARRVLEKLKGVTT